VIDCRRQRGQAHPTCTGPQPAASRSTRERLTSDRHHGCVQATLFRDPSARWFLPGDGAAETPRLQLARTYSLMAVACPSRAGGGGSRPGSLTSKEVVRMLVNSMRCAQLGFDVGV